MKERIKSKIEEVISYIMSKDPEDITYNEYRILDGMVKEIEYNDDRKQRSEEMAKSMAAIFNHGISVPSCLPEPEIKEE